MNKFGKVEVSAIDAARVKITRAAWAKNDAKRDKGLVAPKDVTGYCNIAYADRDEYNTLNLYVPAERTTKNLPVIVSIHGGGYFYGSKELYSFYCMDLARRGFAVVDFDYRLAPDYRFPAPLEDTNAVLTWIYEKREEYGLDVKNVCITGDSAGAQLCSQYAAIWSNPAYAALFDFTVPAVTIRAVSPACGMYDLRKRMTEGKDTDIMRDYFGPDFDENDPRLSVLENINGNYPPAFVFSSYKDFLYAECEPFAEFLKSKGVETVSKIYGTPEKKEIGHVFHVDFRYPEGEEARKDQIEFMKKMCRPVI